MNKTIVALGLIIVILGFGLSLGSTSSHNSISEDFVAEVEDQWTISGEFHEGENLTLIFAPANDWSLLPYPDLGEPEYSKHFLVNITNKAAGNYTLFRVVMAYPRNEIPPAPPYYLLGIYGIEVIHHGGLVVDDSLSEVHGIVKNDGEYSVKCELVPLTVIDKHMINKTTWIHDASPPPQLVLYRVKTTTVKPYGYLLPGGIATAIVGCIFSLWGVHRESPPKRRVRRRTRTVGMCR